MQTFKTTHTYGIAVIHCHDREASQVRRALTLLKRTSPRAFSKSVRYIRCIGVIPGGTGYNELSVQKRVWITQRSILNGPYQYLASLLLHEAHHVAQFRAGKAYSGSRAERDAYLVQRRYLKRIKYFNAVAWLDKQFKAKWWKSMDNNTRGQRALKTYLRTINSMCEC